MSTSKSYNRYPATSVTLVPYLDWKQGKPPKECDYITGLSKANRKRLEKLTGLNLDPIYGGYYSRLTWECSEGLKEAYFDSRLPMDEITYYWLKKHPLLKSMGIKVYLMEPLKFQNRPT